MARGSTREQKKLKDREILGLRAKGLVWMVRLKFAKLAKKLNDLLIKSIIIDVITNEFASFQALRNDMVSYNLIT